MKKFIFSCAILFSYLVFSQEPTIGLRYSDGNISDGYTLFSPERNHNVYLIDNCGELINEWVFDERPALTTYILENGNLLRAGNQNIEIRDWDNNIVWSFNKQSNGLQNQHHDIEPLPNGNILLLLADNYTELEMEALGRVPSATNGEFRLDKIIEIEPSDLNGGNIVWEWKAIDHLVQDFDNTKPNFGVVENHPELIDINFVEDINPINDFTHMNSVDYNADLDQILLSARNLSEIYIIDHSTTTAQASGHVGGNSDAGGDILWRWGNPRVYKQGSASDQKLSKQHDAKWVEPGYLDDGKISVFNNGGNGSSQTFSSVHLIAPEISNGKYTLTNNVFNPQNYDWSWDGYIRGEVVHDFKKSGTHSLPNGNFLFCISSNGQFSEISKTGDELWTYKNPVGTNGAIYTQFDVIVNSLNSLFRAKKYPADYIGFDGKDLTPQGIIENVNTESENCVNALSFEESEFTKFTIINPIKNNVIKFSETIRFEKISIIDINGKTILTVNNFEGQFLPIYLAPSMYFIKLQNPNYNLFKKIVVN
ncbi:aryl-sulfate sulfotransferase [Psychroserpens ponticola]|uniref:Aryl-sulfate sulfotransferase n=1 Tax=Psychroserpens ponticola TaxID=2932268 RepID=A0ABY7RUE9_9FLAO|nr:aryl-sulfate sulfotransferase [Psychroserpens ponticola]WCO00746.1 aryl-sulfate sulfotransferase [Psychroserpens ponticola]